MPCLYLHAFSTRQKVVKRFLCREGDAVTSGSCVEAEGREPPSLRHQNAMWKLCGSKGCQS